MALENIANLAAARSAKKRTTDNAKPPGDDRPVIRLQASHIHDTIDLAEKALIALDDGIYKQGQRLVRVVNDDIKVAGGRSLVAPRISEITAEYLVERFTAAARFEKFDGRSNDWVPCNCPPNVAGGYVARNGNWNLLFLLGITNAPTIRSDGTLLDKPGYDPATGILYDPLNVKFPEIPTEPTKDDALAALGVLKEPLKYFPFANPASASVALSGIMTAIVRRSLPTAPMHAYTAPTAGSGKSLLVDMASVLATGRTASVLHASAPTKFGDSELDKKLTAALLGGSAVISIDNLETPLSGDLLCQMITQESVDLRVLGTSKNISSPSTASLFATGNNLIVVGDLTRRTLIAGLAVDDDRPELREFEFNPVDVARKRRGELVAAALTIMLAYRQVDRQVLQSFGSFDEWSYMVREALVWLGEADPVSVIEDVRSNDPRLQRLGQMINAWGNIFGESPQRVRDVMRIAGQTDDEHGGMLTYPDLKEAIVAIAGEKMSGERFNWWLRKNMNRSVNGVKFERADGGTVVPSWRLAGWGGKSTVGEYGLDLQQPAGNRAADEEIPF